VATSRSALRGLRARIAEIGGRWMTDMICRRTRPHLVRRSRSISVRGTTGELHWVLGKEDRFTGTVFGSERSGPEQLKIPVLGRDRAGMAYKRLERRRSSGDHPGSVVNELNAGV